MFVIWYVNFMLILVNLACITFWYEHSKVGLECLENNVENYIFYNVYHETIQEVKNFI